MNKKKVCYILPEFDLETDSHFFHIYNLINEVSQDLNMTLIIERSKSDISFFKNIKNVYVQKFRFKPLRILENLLFVILVRAKGCNNFYVHYSYIGAFNASLISKLTKAKVFYWNCGMAWLFGKHRILKFILSMIDYLVTGVNALKSGYYQHYNVLEDKVKIMPNWVNLEDFKDLNQDIVNKYKLDNNKKYILFIHRLSRRKGADYIVSVAKSFIDNQDIEFLIAGDGPYAERLKNEIKENNLKNIRLLGRTPTKETPYLMKVSKIFFMPSKEEGFPRVLLESMASGLPYVAFDVGGTREISPREEQEFIYDFADIDSMVKGIKKLLNNEDSYYQVKKANLDNVQRFDISKVKNIFINLFN